MNLKDLKRLYASINSQVDHNDICAYCGALATDDEHVIPYSYIVPYVSERRVNPKREGMVIVRSCRNCNVTAGPKVFDNFWEKKQYIRRMVAKKNEKLINSPDWTIAELSQLDDNLQVSIYDSEIKKKLIKCRLENLDKPEVFGETKEL